MPAKSDTGRVNLGDFFDRVRDQAVPLNTRVSYFAAGATLNEEDLRDYLEDPLAALPPAAEAILPRLIVLLVPYLERANGKTETRAGKGAAAAERGKDHATIAAKGEWVAFESPPDGRALRALRWLEGETLVIVLAIDEMEVAEYHYELYHQLAAHIAESCPPAKVAGYQGLIREELSNHMHGEVDEESWQHKQVLLRRQNGHIRDSKAFREYARHSLVDTLTLYLHGICCDIDVETGPRQLPSRFLRKRLNLIREIFPPPSGYAVFPEELDR
ncbi:MAG: hypothetical protein R2762_01705 [Bryobacteraceae bacterium]